MTRIHVYGSLRIGQYNNDRFKLYFGEKMTYKGTSTVRNFKIYHSPSLPYPHAVKTNNPNDEIEIDTFICSEECVSVITQMEIGAGYSPTQLLDGVIFTVDKEELPKDVKEIDGKSWIEHIKVKK